MHVGFNGLCRVVTGPFSPAADRNKAAILAVLDVLLPANASVLEVASGTGQHAEHFATSRPSWVWFPTDAAEDDLEPIASRLRGLSNVRMPWRLDVLSSPWPIEGRFDAIFCANMLHIAPWPTCAALMRGAATHLAPHGLLITYGPYIVDGEPLAASNADFDADLRRRDATWGLRRLTDVIAEAFHAGLTFEGRWDMPANNLMLAFRAASAHPSQRFSFPSSR